MSARDAIEEIMIACGMGPGMHFGMTEDHIQSTIDEHIETLRSHGWRQEHCICAAIVATDGTVIRGNRHIDCMDALSHTGKVWDGRESQQGFVTSTGRFVGRHEGYQLQIAAGIESFAKDGYRGKRLFSEDLY